VCGKYDDPSIRTGSSFLFHRVNDNKPDDYFDYGAFYAAPAHYMMGGDTWRRWYQQMTTRFKKSALSAPGGMYYWKGKTIIVNDVYTTSVYTTVLAVPYHYLPLYQR
jgi:hypothetical protein